MPRSPARLGEKPAETSQEARVLALLLAARGDVVPTAHIIRDIFPFTSRTRRTVRNLVGENVHRIRVRGYDVRTIKGRGYQLVGAFPGAVLVDIPSHSKPGAKGTDLPPRPCKPGCGKMFKPTHEWNKRCPDCHDKARGLSGDITLGVW